MIPGQNILNMASRIIALQGLVYYHFLGRILNEVGQDVSQYAVGKKISGSFQPIPRNLYMTLGLDLQKNYWNFYSSNNIDDVKRMSSGDQIGFNGQRYQCESNTDWFQVDGWKGALFVHIGLDTGDSNVFGYDREPSENNNLNFGNGNFLGGES